MTDDFKIGFCCRCRRAGLSAERTEALLKKAETQPMTPDQLKKLYSVLKYRVLNKETNRPFFNTNRKAFDHWHLLSPEQIRKHKIGVCWDTAAMTDSELSAAGVPHENYFSHAKDLSRPTHAFNVYRDGNGEWRWIEGSWGKYKDNDWHERRKRDLVRRIVKALEAEGFDEETGGDRQILHKIDKFPEAGVNGHQFFEVMLSAPVKKANFEKQANPFGTVARAVSPAFKRLFRANGAKSRFFKLPSFFKKSPAAPAPTDWSQYFFAPGRWPNNVASFYDDIKLPIKRNSRLAGIPEHDYRQTVLMRRGAYNDVPVKINRNLGPYNGYTHFRRIDSKHVSPTIEVGQYPNHFTLVHEFDHARNGAVGLSEKERNLLAKTYKFTSDDLREAYDHSVESLTPRQQTRAIVDEMSATNSEHQFAVYERLADRLHRNPTYDEYTKFIDNASLSDLRNWRKGNFEGYHRNAYQQSADSLTRNRFSEEDLENYRKALRWLGGFAVAPAAYRMYGTQPQNDGH